MTDLLCSPMNFNFVSCSTMLLHENRSENKKVHEMKSHFMQWHRGNALALLWHWVRLSHPSTIVSKYEVNFEATFFVV